MRAGQRSSATIGAYGPDLGGNFGAEDAPYIVTRTLQRGEIAVTEVCVDRPLGRLSDPIPRMDAYMICLMLREIPDNSYWEDGREVSRFSLRAGEATIHDLQREPLALMDKAIHSLLFYIPQTALNALADQASVPHISELRYTPGVGVVDETIRNIGMSLLPVLRNPEQANLLFTEYATMALGAHAAHAFGGMRTVSKPLQGGLAPWQEKRCKEMMANDLAGTTSLRQIAEACGLSVSHFSRAFRRSTGMAPHAWLMKARVEAAKPMLLKRGEPLFAIARACGFADQSHFSRVFASHVGVTPGAWRKMAFE